MGKQWKQWLTLFFWAPKSLQMLTVAMSKSKRRLLLGRKVMTNLDSILKSGDITLPTKVCLVKAMVFAVVMYGCESWTIKKAERWRIDAFELWCWKRLLRVPWTARRSNQSILKEMFIGRTDAEVEAPIFWPPDAKSWLIWKYPDTGKDWGQEEKGTAEDEVVGWHHRLDGHEFGWTLGVGDGQGGLACCGSWGPKESDMTEWLNWTHSSDCKESACSAGDPGSVPGSGRSPGAGNCNPLLYFCLENPMDSRVWRAAVHGVTKSQTRLTSHARILLCPRWC